MAAGDFEGGGYNRAALGRLVEFIGDHERGARGVEDLRRIIEYSAACGTQDHIKIDPSLARGLSYYTGAIMEISVPDLAGVCWAAAGATTISSGCSRGKTYRPAASRSASNASSS